MLTVLYSIFCQIVGMFIAILVPSDGVVPNVARPERCGPERRGPQ
jgi:hypothetical protein